MGMKGRSAFVSLLLLLPVLLTAEPAEEQRQRLERGRQIYLLGTSPSGGEITAVMSDAGVEVPASTVPCAGCHGRDGKGNREGGVYPSDLTWAALTKPYGVTHPGGRKHPAYDVRTLKRSITLGIDPAGNPLHVAMPRFRMSLQDMEDLIAYVRQLGTGTDPGLTDTTVRVGVVLPPSGPLSGMGRAVRAALTARFEAVNKDGGVYGRRIEPRFFEAPAPADQRRGWTADFLQREEVFAGVAAFFAGADSEMASLFQEKEVPLVGPFTLHPRETIPTNRYVFYLLGGTEVQGQALVHFVRRGSSQPSQAAIVAPGDAPQDGAVEAVARSAAEAGWPAPLVLRLGGGSAADWKRLVEAKADPVIFLGSGPDAVSLLQAADRLGWHPRLLVTAAAASEPLFGAPAAFEGKIFVALPTLPESISPAAAAAYRSLGSLPGDDLSAQFSALAAAEALLEALRRAGRDLSREKLVDELQTLRVFQTGYVPPLTFGPTRRLGARGAYVVRVDLAGKKFVPEGGWVEVE